MFIGCRVWGLEGSKKANKIEVIVVVVAATLLGTEPTKKQKPKKL